MDCSYSLFRFSFCKIVAIGCKKVKVFLLYDISGRFDVDSVIAYLRKTPYKNLSEAIGGPKGMHEIGDFIVAIFV